ncbi:hypothetical protein [Trabulsiella odontotermitis]|uniref:hypothetical protein n=1 Tax=Trabulsiella odontotermitis TaxID=379893 RepID=UPI00128ED066|nr:hypothetical protein [Trabulsiella odontotermitis]
MSQARKFVLSGSKPVGVKAREKAEYADPKLEAGKGKAAKYSKAWRKTASQLLNWWALPQNVGFLSILSIFVDSHLPAS